MRPFDVKSTVAVPPVNEPAVPVFSPIVSVVLSIPCAARFAIWPLAVKPGEGVADKNCAARPSVNASDDVLVTLTLAVGEVVPTRAARLTDDVLSVGLARR